MLDRVGERGRAFDQAQDIIILARAVHALAPDGCDEATRAGLIHLALRRTGQAPQSPLSDCLSDALKSAKTHHGSSTISAEFARVLSLAFAAIAGDLADPASGADVVVLHHMESSQNRQLRPIALLGEYLFFAALPPN